MNAQKTFSNTNHILWDTIYCAFAFHIFRIGLTSRQPAHFLETDHSLVALHCYSSEYSTRRSLASTCAPAETCTREMVPSLSAWMAVSIFIASRVSNRSPA